MTGPVPVALAALAALAAGAGQGGHVTTAPAASAFVADTPFIVVLGIAQAAAVIPGISRSGATISTGLLLKNSRNEVARFSFLMVLLPIIGAALLDILSMSSSAGGDGISVLPLVIGFLAAYLSGFMACRWMISLVKKGNLYWFALYCAIVGIVSIVFA